MMSDKEMYDELVLALAPKIFDQCVEQRIDEDPEDKFAFVNAVGRRTAFLAKQIMIERNRTLSRSENGFGVKNEE